MSLSRFAKKIPDQVRSEKLITETDPIAHALPNAGNKHMQLLYLVWYEFIEPASNGDITCHTCCKRIIENFIAMKQDLVKLEREYKLLESLKG